MMKFIFAIFLSFLPILTYAQVKRIEVGDILRFGHMFLGQTVQIVGVLDDAYGCQLPANRGNRCLEIRNINNPSLGDTAVVKENFYSFEQYKDWLSNKRILVFTGVVELRDGAMAAYGQPTKSPTLILKKIEAAR
jgi:hypothetical protein